MSRHFYIVGCTLYIIFMMSTVIASWENIITPTEARLAIGIISLFFMAEVGLIYYVLQKGEVRHLNIAFTSFINNSNWVKGVVNEGEFTFSARLFDDTSIRGINGGRISKLNIKDHSDKEIATYDRGWDTKPKSLIHKKVYEAVHEFLEAAPKTRFE
jgi:hypothetical protein